MAKKTPKKTIPEPEEELLMPKEVEVAESTAPASTAPAPTCTLCTTGTTAHAPAVSAPAPAASAPAPSASAPEPAASAPTLDTFPLFLLSILHFPPDNQIVPKFRGLIMDDLSASLFAIILQLGLPGILTYLFAPILLLFPSDNRFWLQLVFIFGTHICTPRFKYQTRVADSVYIEGLITIVNAWSVVGVENWIVFASVTGLSLLLIAVASQKKADFAKQNITRLLTSNEKLIEVVRDVERLKDDVLEAHNRLKRAIWRLMPVGLCLVAVYALSSLLTAVYDDPWPVQRGLAFMLLSLLLAAFGAVVATFLVFKSSVEHLTQPAFSYRLSVCACLKATGQVFLVYFVASLIVGPSDAMLDLVHGPTPRLKLVYWRFCDYALLLILTLGLLGISAMYRPLVRGELPSETPTETPNQTQTNQAQTNQTQAIQAQTA